MIIEPSAIYQALSLMPLGGIIAITEVNQWSTSEKKILCGNVRNKLQKLCPQSFRIFHAIRNYRKWL